MPDPLKKKVLIVDDDEALREALSGYLETQGFETLHSENALEELLQMKQERPGVIVLDLGMPWRGGLEALKRIRNFDPLIRVIVITSTTDPQLREQALALGALRVLTKPFALVDLDDAIRQI